MEKHGQGTKMESEELLSPVKLPPKSAMKKITRQNAVTTENCRVKKQLSFPEDLPRYHQEKETTHHFHRLTQLENDNSNDNKQLSSSQSENFSSKKLHSKKTRPTSKETQPKNPFQPTRKSSLRKSHQLRKHSISSPGETRQTKMRRSVSVAELSSSSFPANVHKNSRQKSHAPRKFLLKQHSLPETSTNPAKSVKPNSNLTLKTSCWTSKLIPNPKPPSLFTSNDQQRVPKINVPQNYSRTTKPRPKSHYSSTESHPTPSKPPSTQLEDLLGALQVKPANKFHPLTTKNKQKQFRNFRDRSIKGGCVGGVDVLAFPEVTTLIADVSPVLSDNDSSDHISSWAIPIAGPDNYSLKANFGKLLRPAFLKRPTNIETNSQGSSRQGSAQSSTNMSTSCQVTKPDVNVVHQCPAQEDNKSSLLTIRDPITKSPVTNTNPTTKFKIPTIKIEDTSKTSKETPKPTPNPKTSPTPRPFTPPPQPLPCQLHHPEDNKNAPGLLVEEKHCLSLQQKLQHKGLDVPLETLQRALMTPTEFRLVHHARRAQSCILGSRTVR